MKKVEKSIDEMVSSVSEIKEDQLGKLQGGFSDLGVSGGGDDAFGTNNGCTNTNCPCSEKVPDVY